MSYGGQIAETLVDGFSVLLISDDKTKLRSVVNDADHYLELHYKRPDGKPRPWVAPRNLSTRPEMDTAMAKARFGILELDDYLTFFSNVLMDVGALFKTRKGLLDPFGLVLTSSTYYNTQNYRVWMSDLGVQLVINLDDGTVSSPYGVAKHMRSTPRRFRSRDSWQDDDSFDGLPRRGRR